MKYMVNINGIDVLADFSEEDINNKYIPILKKLEKMHDEKKSRILMMLAAPPGAGKSTLASFLEHLSTEVLKDKKVVAIGMDGFHKRQEYLVSHTTTIDGVTISLKEIKGAPVTFDLDGLTRKIKDVKSGALCRWPMYDRLLHNPVEDAITVNGDIIILEGNYLLLNKPGWRELSSYADFTAFIKRDPDMLRKRLIERKIASGTSRDDAVKFVDFSDMKNVMLCLEYSMTPDVML